VQEGPKKGPQPSRTVYIAALAQQLSSAVLQFCRKRRNRPQGSEGLRVEMRGGDSALQASSFSFEAASGASNSLGRDRTLRALSAQRRARRTVAGRRGALHFPMQGFRASIAARRTCPLPATAEEQRS